MKIFYSIMTYFFLIKSTKAFELEGKHYDLYCQKHPDHQVIFANFEEKLSSDGRLLCKQCLLEATNKNQKLTLLVDLNDFANNPEETLLRVKQERGNDITSLQNIDKHLLQIQQGILDQLINIKQNIKQIKVQIESINRHLDLNLRLKETVSQFQLISEMDSCQQTKERIILEEHLNFISQNLGKTIYNAKNNINDNQLLIINNLNNNFKIIQNDINYLNQIVINQLMTIISQFPANMFEELYQFPDIHYLISGGQKISYELIYQGSRDGLNAQSYWQKCNQKSHLLTIMTSRNGNKFGGYSPCQINVQWTMYIHDPTMKSFLFQYNKKEIYKLNSQEHAIFNNQGYGPIFGQGHDLFISSNFNEGSSNLGISYDISNYKVNDKTTHLFGDKNPQLAECKVYRVIFQ